MLVDVNTVDEVILIIPQKVVGNRTHKTAVEDEQEIIVNVDGLVHIAQKLGNGCVFQSRDLRSQNYLLLALRISGVIHIGGVFRNSNWQKNFTIVGGVGIIENEIDRFEHLALRQFVAVIVHVELNLIVNAVLIRIYKCRIVLLLVAYNLAHDAVCGIFARLYFDHIEHGFGRFELNLQVVYLIRLNLDFLWLETQIRNQQRVDGFVNTEIEVAVDVAVCTNGGAFEHQIYEGKRFGCFFIRDSTPNTRNLCRKTE